MNEFVKQDLKRYGVSSKREGKKYPGFHFMCHFRNASCKSKYSLLGAYHRWKLIRLRYKYGFQISLGTKIGKGFYIGHFGTIVINGASEIGENCNIAHLVTIGQANRGKYKGAPKIGNKVYIGTGAVIVGKITIGDNVLIAPNTVVNRDVPNNSICQGNPMTIISKENATEGYINNY